MSRLIPARELDTSEDFQQRGGKLWADELGRPWAGEGLGVGWLAAIYLAGIGWL